MEDVITPIDDLPPDLCRAACTLLRHMHRASGQYVAIRSEQFRDAVGAIAASGIELDVYETAQAWHVRRARKGAA